MSDLVGTHTPFGTSIAGALERIADLFGDDLAIVQGARTLTWREFDDLAARLASFFAAVEVTAGDRVAIGCRNQPEYLVAMFAAQKLRAIPVNVNFRYRFEELEYILTDAGARVLVHDDALEQLVPRLADSVHSLEASVSVGVNAGESRTATSIHKALLAEPHPRIDRAGELTWIIYTGGTTGRPKAVAFTEESVLARMGSLVFRSLGIPEPISADALWATLIERHPERLVVLPASPLMHGAGVYGSLNALLSGGTVVLLAGRRFEAQEVAEAIGRHHVTDVHLVGDVFALPLVEALDAARASGKAHDLSSLKRIQSVGTVWSPEVKSALLQEADVALVDLIAATEGGPFAVAVATHDTDPAEFSSFRLAHGARLIDRDGRDVAPGSDTVGVLAAPAQDGARYLGDPERSSAVFRNIDGALYAMPGDLAQLRPDGTLRFLGRGSGVINTGGEKVYAMEVEDALRSHPEVKDAVVAAVPDARYGSLVGAVVEPKSGCAPEPDALGDHVAAALAGYKRPRRIAIVPELRRTAVGKADLAWAREMLSVAPESRLRA
jgi:3-oxocholest-4-en-26-oate---CoA ligase